MSESHAPDPDMKFTGAHMSHCYQGENDGGCKYGDSDCPAKPKAPADAMPELSQRVRYLEEVIRQAAIHIAATGAPFTNGRYDKNGEWSFTKMTESGNEEDAKEIKKAFLLLHYADLTSKPTDDGGR